RVNPTTSAVRPQTKRRILSPRIERTLEALPEKKEEEVSSDTESSYSDNQTITDEEVEDKNTSEDIYTNVDVSPKQTKSKRVEYNEETKNIEESKPRMRLPPVSTYVITFNEDGTVQNPNPKITRKRESI